MTSKHKNECINGKWKEHGLLPRSRKDLEAFTSPDAVCYVKVEG